MKFMKCTRFLPSRDLQPQQMIWICAKKTSSFARFHVLFLPRGGLNITITLLKQVTLNHLGLGCFSIFSINLGKNGSIVWVFRWFFQPRQKPTSFFFTGYLRYFGWIWTLPLVFDLQASPTVNVGITTESPKKIQIPETNIWWYFEGIFFEGGIENHQKKGEKSSKKWDGWNIILSFWQSAVLFRGLPSLVRFQGVVSSLVSFHWNIGLFQ